MYRERLLLERGMGRGYRADQRLGVACVATLAGFLVIAAGLSPTGGDASTGASMRVPEQERLARLIRVEQRRAADLQSTAEALRREVQELTRARSEGGPGPDAQLAPARALLGLVPAEGPGLVVTLDDSSLQESPSGNLNDLVVHSQDVQAVTNALWAAGAEALAVSSQRVVPTSALLCVGNTLLINGTVHSPPYRFVAIGADLENRVLADPLVQRLRRDAEQFRLGFEVEEQPEVRVPAYRGRTTIRYAQPG